MPENLNMNQSCVSFGDILSSWLKYFSEKRIVLTKSNVLLFFNFLRYYKHNYVFWNKNVGKQTQKYLFQIYLKSQ